MTDYATDILAHHGVKGMKWGVRRSRSESTHTTSMKNLKKTSGTVSKSKTEGTSSHDARTANSLHAKAKTHGTASLSNKEMQDLVTRMNLEQQYTRLSTTQKNTGSKFVKDLLVNVAKQQVTQLANDQVRKQLGKTLLKAAVG